MPVRGRCPSRRPERSWPSPGLPAPGRQRAARARGGSSRSSAIWSTRSGACSSSTRAIQHQQDRVVYGIDVDRYAVPARPRHPLRPGDEGEAAPRTHPGRRGLPPAAGRRVRRRSPSLLGPVGAAPGAGAGPRWASARLVCPAARLSCGPGQRWPIQVLDATDSHDNPPPHRRPTRARRLRPMPSLRHELIAWALPRVRRTRDLDTPRTSGARLLRRNDALEPALPTGLVPRFHRWFAVEEETLSGPAGDFPSYVVTPAVRRPRAHDLLRARRRLRRADRPVPRALRHPAGLRAARRGWCCRLPARAASTPGATPTTMLADQLAALGRPRPGGARRRLGRRRDRARAGRDAARPRRPAAQPPAADLAVGRPDHQHPGDQGGRRDRPVAVHRQDARVRRLVGRRPRGPRPARGLARARPARRAAAGADVLRHPRPAGARAAGCSPTARPRRTGTSPTSRRRACCTSSRCCRSSPRRAAPGGTPWSSCDEPE